MDFSFLFQDLAMVGSFTAVIVGFAMFLARKEDRERAAKATRAQTVKDIYVRIGLAS